MNKICKRCLTQGHISADCETAKWCSQCKILTKKKIPGAQYGLADTHCLGECPNVKFHQCSFCGETGHVAMVCPSPHGRLMGKVVPQ